MSHDSGNKNTMWFTHNYLDGNSQLIPELCTQCHAVTLMINTGDALSKDFIWLNSIQ